MAPTLMDLPTELAAIGESPEAANIYRGDRWSMWFHFDADVSAYDFHMIFSHSGMADFEADVDASGAGDAPNFAIFVSLEAAVTSTIAVHELPWVLQASTDETWYRGELPVVGPYNEVGSP